MLCGSVRLPAALQVMKLGQLEITDGWMDGEKEVYKFTTRPNVSIPQGLNRYLPGGELVYTGELLRVQCYTDASMGHFWDSRCCARCRPGCRLVYPGHAPGLQRLKMLQAAATTKRQDGRCQ